MGNSPLGDVGDIVYPHYLINGRVPAEPLTLWPKAWAAGSYPADQRCLRHPVPSGTGRSCGHGHPYRRLRGAATETRALYLAQGERADLVVTSPDGVFPLVAAAEGKKGQGLILIRTGAGRNPQRLSIPLSSTVIRCC